MLLLLALVACASTKSPGADFVVLESHKFT
jgi:hypothetical protein